VSLAEAVIRVGEACTVKLLGPDGEIGVSNGLRRPPPNLWRAHNSGLTTDRSGLSASQSPIFFVVPSSLTQWGRVLAGPDSIVRSYSISLYTDGLRYQKTRD
jgi:hypothetical protein